MLQRQLHKKALSGVVVDEYNTEESRRFSVTELRELFVYKESKSVIHDSLNCKRCQDGVEVKKPEKGGDPTDLGCWNHSQTRKGVFETSYKRFFRYLMSRFGAEEKLGAARVCGILHVPQPEPRTSSD